MPRWTVTKRQVINHDNGVEVVKYEADIHLNADDAENQPTLADVAQLVQNLTTEQGIPITAKLGVTIDAPLRWTDDDLTPPEPT